MSDVYSHVLFKDGKLYEQFKHWGEVDDAYGGNNFPDNSYLFSIVTRNWYNHKGVLIKQEDVPPYALHLQLVLGL